MFEKFQRKMLELYPPIIIPLLTGNIATVNIHLHILQIYVLRKVQFYMHNFLTSLEHYVHILF